MQHRRLVIQANAVLFIILSVMNTSHGITVGDSAIDRPSQQYPNGVGLVTEGT